MRNSALGVNGGASKTMHAIIFFHVDWTSSKGLLQELDAVVHGAGRVEKNTVPRILILTQVKNFLQEKTTTMQTVVAKNRASKKKTIVLEAIAVIVANVGSLTTNQSECPA